LTSKGEILAKHLAEHADSGFLRQLCDQIQEPKQRQLLMEGMFESLDPVSKLGFVGEFGGTPKTLAAERGEEPIVNDDVERKGGQR
jgi:hypothetical protein